MLKDEIESVETASPNILVEQTDQLKLIFPQVFSEGKIDFKKLRAALGDMVDTQPERYSFTWAGKRNATLLLQTPSYATLTPSEDESVNFENTQNQFIEGDNLEVLKLLYKSYSGRVKMIYIDPPYNTGNDFVYPDNYADPLETYLEVTGQKDANGNLLTSNPETSGRYHSAWLSMMYPRLYIARQLLRDDGVIFVSIDDHEIHNLRLLMNEIFGEENFIGMFVWQSKKGGGSDTATIVSDQEYVLCFSRTGGSKSLTKLVIEAEELHLVDAKGPYRRGRELNKWGANSRREDRPTMYFPIPGPNGEDVFPLRNDGAEGRWRLGTKKMFEIVGRKDAEFVRRPNGTYIVYEKIRSTDPRDKPFRTWLTNVGTTADGSKTVKELFDGRKIYDFPKPVDLLKLLVSMGTIGTDDIILDFFAGSCTTAHAVLELNHENESSLQFICVQLPELTPTDSEARKAGYKTICEIAKERIRRVIAQISHKNAGMLDLSSREAPEDLGFRVFKLAASNYKQWKSIDASDPEAYTRQLDMFADLLVDNWNTISVLWEVSIKEGYGLNAQLGKLEEVQDNTVWRITDSDKDQSMLVCLDDELKPSTLSALPLSKEHVFVCRNKALDDTKAANLALQCRLKKI